METELVCVGTLMQFSGETGWLKCRELEEEFDGGEVCLHKKDITTGTPILGAEVSFRLILDDDGQPHAAEAIVKSVMEGKIYTGILKSFNGTCGKIKCPEIAKETGGRDVSLDKEDLVSGKPSLGARVSFCLIFDENGNPKAVGASSGDQAAPDKAVGASSGDQAAPDNSIPAAPMSSSSPDPDSPFPGRTFTGHVKSFTGSFGWLICPEVAEAFGGRDTFLHKRDIDSKPVIGAAVRFRLVLDEKGNPKAMNATMDPYKDVHTSKPDKHGWRWHPKVPEATPATERKKQARPLWTPSLGPDVGNPTAWMDAWTPSLGPGFGPQAWMEAWKPDMPHSTTDMPHWTPAEQMHAWKPDMGNPKELDATLDTNTVNEPSPAASCTAASGIEPESPYIDSTNLDAVAPKKTPPRPSKAPHLSQSDVAKPVAKAAARGLPKRPTAYWQRIADQMEPISDNALTPRFKKARVDG